VYGSLVTGIAAVVSSVLSSNPFANLSQSITILTLVIALIFVVLLGTAVMIRWDMLDHNKLFYLGRNNMRQRNKKLYDVPFISEREKKFLLFKTELGLKKNEDSLNVQEEMNYEAKLSDEGSDDDENEEDYDDDTIGNLNHMLHETDDLKHHHHKLPSHWTDDQKHDVDRQIKTFLDTVIPPTHTRGARPDKTTAP
jgi:hypothetical protein